MNFAGATIVWCLRRTPANAALGLRPGQLLAPVVRRMASFQHLAEHPAGIVAALVGENWLRIFGQFLLGIDKVTALQLKAAIAA